MRYFILFTIFSCSISLFAQSNSDTATIILEEVKVIEVVRPINNLGTICPIGYLPIKKIAPAPVYNNNLLTVEEPNQSLKILISCGVGGFKTYPFRFENINRMANTVAGVLCY